jgi:hypothetical protein
MQSVPSIIIIDLFMSSLRESFQGLIRKHRMNRVSSIPFDQGTMAGMRRKNAAVKAMY